MNWGYPSAEDAGDYGEAGEECEEESDQESDPLVEPETMEPPQDPVKKQSKLINEFISSTLPVVYLCFRSLNMGPYPIEEPIGMCPNLKFLEVEIDGSSVADAKNSSGSSGETKQESSGS